MIKSKSDNNSVASEKNSATDLLDEASVFMAWLQSAATTGSDIVDLFQLELRLAITDVKRLMLLAKLLMPILVLAWMCLSSVLSWHVYLLNSSVTQGLWFLCILQFLALLMIVIGLKVYQKNLTLPLTRRHIKQFIDGHKGES